MVQPYRTKLLQKPYTRQNLELANAFFKGMTTAQVSSLMGPPAKTQQNRDVEEWYYCQTGQQLDEFVTTVFRQGRLIASEMYRVGPEDGVAGDCSLNIKLNRYDEP